MAFWKKLKLADVSKPLPIEVARKKAKILVIDDEPESFPCDLLRKEGYSIECWRKVESLSPLEQAAYDIIILDIAGVAGDYAKEDGLAVLEHLKKYNPSQIIVAFSGLTFDLSKTRFWKMADDSLSKPVDAIKCKEIIDQLLREKFTIEHYWNGVTSIFHGEGVSPEEIEKIEHKVAKAIKGGNSKKLMEAIESVAVRGEILAKVVIIGQKLITLFGSN